MPKNVIPTAKTPAAPATVRTITITLLLSAFPLTPHSFPSPSDPPPPSLRTRATMTFRTTATLASFGGTLLKLTHPARSTACDMALNLFLPPQALRNPLRPVPVLLFLAGLTCSGDNCAEKGFLQHKASERGVAVVYPDTSPREWFEGGFSLRGRLGWGFGRWRSCFFVRMGGCVFAGHGACLNQLERSGLIRRLCRLGGLNIQGEDDEYDFGSGAGFYVDATEDPWRKGYQMYSYITEELPKALFESFKELDPSRVSITGHSMGGHGALTLVGLSVFFFLVVTSVTPPYPHPHVCHDLRHCFHGRGGHGDEG